MHVTVHMICVGAIIEPFPVACRTESLIRDSWPSLEENHKDLIVPLRSQSPRIHVCAP